MQALARDRGVRRWRLIFGVKIRATGRERAPVLPVFCWDEPCSYSAPFE